MHPPRATLDSVPSDSGSFLSARSSFTSQPEDDQDVVSLCPFEACCRACFNNDSTALQSILESPSWSPDVLARKDRHGLTALHVAAMRNSSKCIAALLAAGADVTTKSIGGWSPIEEAFCYSSSLAVTILLKEHERLISTRMTQQIAQLKDVLKGMPDCAFQISWDLSSPYLGAVLHKHLPKDTYTVWKRGGRLRIDGHMKGMNEDAATLLPTWKYGHFSLLVDTNDRNTKPVYVSHDKQRYTVLDVLSDNNDGEHHSYSEGMYNHGGDQVTTSRIKFSNFRMAPVKGWLSAESRETVNGMPTVLYEAQGELMAVTTVKSQLKLPAGATYQDYLARQPVPNVEATVPLNFSSGFNASAADDAARTAHAQAQPGDAQSGPTAPARSNGAAELRLSGAGDNVETGAASRRALSHSRSSHHSGLSAAAAGSAGGGALPATASGSGSYSTPTLEGGDAAGAVLKTRGKGSGRKMKARLWLAKGLPINQRQLLPLLDIISTQNKYIGKVSRFMQQYGDQELFPVKVQVPLVLSMRIMLNVKNICVWVASDKGAKATCAKAPQNMRAAPPPEFFQPPEAYTPMTMEELGKEKRKKHQLRTRRTRAAQAPAIKPPLAPPVPEALTVQRHNPGLNGMLPVADWDGSPVSSGMLVGDSRVQAHDT